MRETKVKRKFLSSVSSGSLICSHVRIAIHPRNRFLHSNIFSVYMGSFSPWL